jgi:MoxR-like ATPase
MTAWRIYHGTGTPHDGIEQLPSPLRWRQFSGQITDKRQREQDPYLEQRFGDLSRGQIFQASEKENDFVNSALYLRLPLLVTGKPGTGKSSLAYAVAHELKLGRVLRWPITSRSTLQEGLYRYDAIGHIQEANLTRKMPDIGQFIRLGPLGTALLPSRYPHPLLIDEIDKSDIDLPNDLLNIFEEGEFEIPELARLSENRE